MTAFDRVMNRATPQSDFDHLATRFVHGFLHCHRDLTGLALAHPDATVTVADYREGGKSENTATLDYFGHAVDRNHFLAKAVVALFALHSGRNLCHIGYPWIRI
jgi:hypothetical protein